MASFTLIVGVLKYFLIFGGLLWFWSFGSFVLWWFWLFLLFSVRPRDRLTRMLIVYTCIKWSFDCTPWLLEQLNICLLWFWSFGSFVLWCFCQFLLFTVRFPHDRMMRMLIVHTCIMWSWDRSPWLLEYWNIFSCFGGFVCFDSDPLGLLSYGAFVHFSFSLSAHVIAWWECWWSTPVSCDHDIVHLDCRSIKIFSDFWGFCPLWFWSFGSFVLWCFCPFLLFSIRPRDCITRMLIIHTCIMWSWHRAPWLLEY